MAFPIWDWKEKPEIAGILTAKLKNLPPYGKRLYGIQLDSGAIWYIWGTSVLVGLLAPLNFHTKIKLKFLGKGREDPTDKFDKNLFEMKIIALPKKQFGMKTKDENKKIKN